MPLALFAWLFAGTFSVQAFLGSLCVQQPLLPEEPLKMLPNRMKLFLEQHPGPYLTTPIMQNTMIANAIISNTGDFQGVVDLAIIYFGQLHFS